MGKSSTEVSEITGLPISTVAGWVQRYHWEQLRNETSVISQGKVLSDLTAVVSEDAEKHISIYKKMQEKGLSELEARNARTAGEAGELADRGIKGERAIVSGLVSRKLISLLAQVIGEEITDATVRERIATRLRDALNAET
jgi:hypothetical protein